MDVDKFLRLHSELSKLEDCLYCDSDGVYHIDMDREQHVIDFVRLVAQSMDEASNILLE